MARSADEAERLARGEDVTVRREGGEEDAEAAAAAAAAAAMFEPEARREQEDEAKAPEAQPADKA